MLILIWAINYSMMLWYQLYYDAFLLNKFQTAFFFVKKINKPNHQQAWFLSVILEVIFPDAWICSDAGVEKCVKLINTIG